MINPYSQQCSGSAAIYMMALVDLVAHLVWMWWLNLYTYFASVDKSVVAQLVRVSWLSWYGCGGSIYIDVVAQFV
jgi:hypothetical protein